MNTSWSKLLELAPPLFTALTGVAFIVGLITYVVNNTIQAGITRLFLRQNTLLAEKVKQEFTHALEDHRASLTKSLDDYRSGLNRSLEEYKAKLNHDLANQVEPLKASLSRENISYQIAHTEYVRRQFLRVEELYALLIDLNRFILARYIYDVNIDQEELDKMKYETFTKIKDVQYSMFVAAFFLQDVEVDQLFAYTTNILTMVEIFEGYCDAAKSARDKSYDAQEHKSAVESETIIRQHFLDKKDEVRKGIKEIAKALKVVVSRSAYN